MALYTVLVEMVIDEDSQRACEVAIEDLCSDMPHAYVSATIKSVPVRMFEKDKRHLFKTAQIAVSGKVFNKGEFVSISVRHEMIGSGWIFNCSITDEVGTREDRYIEDNLTNFCF